MKAILEIEISPNGKFCTGDNGGCRFHIDYEDSDAGTWLELADWCELFSTKLEADESNELPIRCASCQKAFK